MRATLQAITRQLAQQAHSKTEYQSHQPLYGGDINQSFLLNTTGNGRFFIKINQAQRLSMFEAEAAALYEMEHSKSIRVPHPILSGSADKSAFLVLEYIELKNANTASEALLGHQLAAMHRTTQQQFGWHRDNTIGSTPQLNALENHWHLFWQRQRIAPQLHWAAERGAPKSLCQKGEKLLDQLPQRLEGHTPAAALLHGDLWGGNWSTTQQGEPLLYDPALYYGDRETDLAMTELFGGFSQRFYAAYNESYPLQEGYAQRKKLYNLYHTLNHFNLFGGSYGRQAEQMIDHLLG